MSKGRFLFLGTGSSMGVPVISCTCSVCKSPSKFNKRTRPSALVTFDNKKLLVDAGPDFRFQALEHGIQHLDGVFLTHTHFDHIGGIDELRIFYFKQHKRIPCVLSKESFKDLKTRYDYLMQPVDEEGSISAQIDFRILEKDNGSSTLEHIPFRYVLFSQKGMPVTGFIFGNLAYISDIKDYPDSLLKQLKGTEILVISAARESTSRMHLSLEEAAGISKAIGAKKTYFTHLSHEVDHEVVAKKLEPNMYLAYDGLEIEFSL